MCSQLGKEHCAIEGRDYFVIQVIIYCRLFTKQAFVFDKHPDIRISVKQPICGIKKIIELIFHHLHEIIGIRKLCSSVFHQKIADHLFVLHIKEISSSHISLPAIQLEDIISEIR